MGLGKSIGFGIVIFIGINFVIALIAALFSNQITAFFGTLLNMNTLATVLFGAVTVAPSVSWMAMFSYATGGYFVLGLFILNIGYIIAPLLGAFVAGRYSEGKIPAFGAWMIISLITAALVMVLGMIGGTPIILNIIITILQNGLLMGIFYSCFALLAIRSDNY